MGLMVHSIGILPKESARDYYVYLLDYGWEGSLGHVLMENFGKLSAYASKNNFVVMSGTPGCHFSDEVFSWHGINGDKDPDLLPSILITKVNPHYFSSGNRNVDSECQLHEMALIPLKKCCKTDSDVAALLEKVVKNLVDKKPLKDFQVSKIMKKGTAKAVWDSLILEPNFSGIGVNLKEIFGTR